MNSNKLCFIQFAQNPDYIFVAAQFIERYDLERQIKLSMRKGNVKETSDGQKMILDENVYNLLKNIPGTPSYWHKFRMEIFSRMEQLGPFHIFFTLSCGECR